MEGQKEKRYRQVQVWLPEIQAKRILDKLETSLNCETVKAGKVLISANLPERLAWLIEKRIGPNSIHALACIYLFQFGKGEHPIDTGCPCREKPLNKLLKDFLKAFAVGKVGLNIDFEPSEADLKKVA